MPVETVEEAKGFVRSWMESRKIFKGEEKNDLTHFGYLGTWVTGVNFSAQQPKDIPRVVGITAKLLIDPRHLKVLSSLSQQKRAEFFNHLNKELVFISPTFSFGPLWRTNSGSFL